MNDVLPHTSPCSPLPARVAQVSLFRQFRRRVSARAFIASRFGETQRAVRVQAPADSHATSINQSHAQRSRQRLELAIDAPAPHNGGVCCCVEAVCIRHTCAVASTVHALRLCKPERTPSNPQHATCACVTALACVTAEPPCVRVCSLFVACEESVVQAHALQVCGE